MLILCVFIATHLLSEVKAQNNAATAVASLSAKTYTRLLGTDTQTLLSHYSPSMRVKDGGGYEKGRITLGGGLGYGLDVSKPSLGVRAQYFFTPKIAAQAGFSTYLMGEEGFSYREIDLNANYYFPLDGSLQPYALAGLGFATVTVSFLGEKATASNTGFNIGGGADYLFSEKLCAFGELRYVASEAGQLVIQAGVRFALK